MRSTAPTSPQAIVLIGKGAGGFPDPDPDDPGPPGRLELAPDPVSFGSVAVGSTASRTVTLRNTTGAPVTVSVAPPAPGAAFTWSRFDGVLSNNAQRAFAVQFRPVVNGIQNGRFTVTVPASGASRSVGLIGKGGIGGFPAPP